MAKQLHTQEKLNSLRVVNGPHRIHPDYHTENFFAIATAQGEGDLEQKAKDGFKDTKGCLPVYVYIPEKHELGVGDSIVHYALVCGVYSR